MSAAEMKELALEKDLLNRRQIEHHVMQNLVATGVKVSPYMMEHSKEGRTTRLFLEARVNTLLANFQWSQMAPARAIIHTSSLREGSELYKMFEAHCTGALRLPGIDLKNKAAWLSWARQGLVHHLATKKHLGDIAIEILAGNHTNEAFKLALEDKDEAKVAMITYRWQPVDLYLDIDIENHHCLWLSSSENERNTLSAQYGGQSCDMTGILFR
jgi:hypothetical protein